MGSSMKVGPGGHRLAAAVWAAVSAEGVEPFSAEAYRRWREGYDRFGDGLPRPASTRIAQVHTGATDAELVTSAPGRQERMLLHAHGGGYVLGSPVSHRCLAGHLAARIGGGVLLPRYRLSPESRYPDAVHDVLAAYRHLLDQGHDAASIVLGGDSAGGGIALATLFRIRDAALPLPAGLVMLSPWADMTRPGAGSRLANADDPLYDADFFTVMTAAVVGDGDPADPMVSPVNGDFTALPPILVHVGSGEALRDDGELVAERAAQAGVDVTLRVWDGAGHNFQVFPGFFEPGDPAWEALDDIGRFITRLTLG